MENYDAADSLSTWAPISPRVIHEGTLPSVRRPFNPSNPRAWVDDWTTQGRDLTLSRMQCQDSFPELYHEIARALQYTRAHGNISTSDLDTVWRKDGIVRAMIYDHKLYVVSASFSGAGYDSTRSLSLLHSINRALMTASEPIPNIEFTFVPADIADPDRKKTPVWALSRQNHEEEKWLMPDFSFWSWPLDPVGEYSQVREQIQRTEPVFEYKIPKAVWRGAVKTNPLRKQLIKATNNQPWADVVNIGWSSRLSMASSSKANSLSMPDHCQYTFVIHTEGRSYSSRLNYLLNCMSAPVIHSLSWITHTTHLLKPDQNFIPVHSDFSDLESQISRYLDKPEQTLAIAKNSIETFRDRYLTPSAQVCYWRELFYAWATVSPDPQLWTDDGLLKGIPFETFALVVKDDYGKACSWVKKKLKKC